MIDLKQFRKDKGIRQKDLAELIGVTAQSISNVETGKMDVPTDWIKLINEKYKVDLLEYDVIDLDHSRFEIEDLMNEFNLTISDLAEILKTDLSIASLIAHGKRKINKKQAELLNDKLGINIEIYREIKRNDVPVYSDAKVYGGFEDAITDVITLKPSTIVNIPFFRGCDGAVQVTGNSMKGLINNGDFVGVKRLYDWNEIIYGEPHLIITKIDKEPTVKFLKRHETNDDLFWLVPYNIEQFEPQEIAKANISHIYRVKGRLNPF